MFLKHLFGRSDQSHLRVSYSSINQVLGARSSSESQQNLFVYKPDLGKQSHCRKIGGLLGTM